MKNFDLAAAKAGAAVCTRSKKPVEIICRIIRRRPP